MAESVASFGDFPSLSIDCFTASTTTIASSTTMPIASTKPNSVSVFTEKPNSTKNEKVPMIDTGMASTGINVARQSCRNKKITKTTNNNAINRGFDHLGNGYLHHRNGFKRHFVVDIRRKFPA